MNLYRIWPVLWLAACAGGEDTSDTTDTSDADTDTDTDTDTDADTDADTDTDTGPEPIVIVGTAMHTNNCGPAGGGAWVINIDETRGMPACYTNDSTLHSVRLWLHSTLPTAAPATMEVGTGETSLGTATYCPDLETPTCHDAVSGTVSFTTLTDGVEMAGSYEFTVADGTVYAGDFSTPFCTNVPECR